MSKANDIAYFTRRAAAERELAQNATIPCAATAHQQLSEAYLERAATLKKGGSVRELKPRQQASEG